MRFELGPGLECDLDTLMETRLLVQANSGFGKSHLLRRILEQTHGHVQQLVIDTEGEFYTLRERFDYVLVAKEGGEAAAEPRIAPLLTRRLLELGASAILDISELKPEARISFVRRVSETLVDVPRSLWHDTLIIFDEAQIFCPQSGKAESMGPINDLMGRARKRGFCPMLATLRLAMLHKDSANLCTNKLIGQGMEDDAKRGAENLGFPGREGWQRIQNLDVGEFYAIGPALSKVVTKVTIGDTLTKVPKRGAERTPTPPPAATIKKLLPKLSDLPAEAEQERKTLEDIKRELSQARRDLTLAKKDQRPPDESVIERRVAVAVGAKERELAGEQRVAAQRVTSLERVIKDAGGQLAGLAEKMAKAVNGASNDTGIRRERPMPDGPQRPQQRRGTTEGRDEGQPLGDGAPARTGHANAPTASREVYEPGDEVTKPQQRILDVLAELESIGVEQPHKTVVAVFAEVSPKSGGYFNNLGRLRSMGLVTYPQGSIITLSEEGRALAVPHDPPGSVSELHEAWFRRVPMPQAALLRELVAIHPEDIDKDELAERVGVSPSSGGYFNNLGRLRSLGAIDYPTGGRAVATELLFPEGLA